VEAPDGPSRGFAWTDVYPRNQPVITEKNEREVDAPRRSFD